MRTPRAHPRRPERHEGVPFEPDCPRCRDEPLTGPPARGVVPRRVVALLAAGVLAICAAPALATEPDQEQEGTTAPGQSSDSAADPDLDPGDGEATPVDPQPGADNEASPVDPGVGGGDSTTDPQQPPPPATAAPPAQAAAPPAASATPTPAPALPAPTAAPQPAASATPAPVSLLALAHGMRGRHTLILKRARVRRVAPRTVSTPTPSSAIDVTPTPAPAVIPGDSATAQSTPASSDGRVRRAGRVHVVRAGESLWSIAGDLLGSDASPARVAREVDRLWQRNRERIATGDPDLLRVGTTLKLR